jgi:hypothetical protein
MLGRGRSAKLRKNAVDASELARQLAQDRKFRKRLSSAIGHGVKARRRARRELGVAGTIRRLASDERLLRELRSARDDLQQANRRIRRRRRSHKLRNAALIGSLAGLAAVPQVRQRVAAAVSDEGVRRDAVERLRKLRTSSGADRFGQPSGQPGSLEDLTRDELYARAQEAEIPGRSDMSKEELVEALRSRR